MGESYSVRVKCANCAAEGNVKVQKGFGFVDYKPGIAGLLKQNSSVSCPTCGNFTLQWVKKSGGGGSAIQGMIGSEWS